MLSYRYMHMNMGENKDGNDKLSAAEILDADGYNYLVSPLEMEMDMHMFGLMYAPTDKLTLMAMVNMIDITMDHQIRDMLVTANINSNTFSTESDDFGDTQIGGIYELSQKNGKSWLLNLGLSIPTGSIDEEDIIPTLSTTEDSQLPFPMQIGSGTYDLLPGITYSQINADTSWGSQIKATVRLGDNDNGYTKGNRLDAQVWHAWRLNHNMSFSTRLSVADWSNYDGLDEKQSLPVFNSVMGVNTVPTVNPDLRGGQQADFSIGMNSVWGESEHRIAAELTYPFWHDLDGPQLATDLTFTLGYQIAF